MSNICFSLYVEILYNEYKKLLEVGDATTYIWYENYL